MPNNENKLLAFRQNLMQRKKNEVKCVKCVIISTLKSKKIHKQKLQQP